MSKRIYCDKKGSRQSVGRASRRVKRKSPANRYEMLRLHTMGDKAATSPIVTAAARTTTATTLATAQKKTTAVTSKQPRAKPAHPKTAEMVIAAITALKERGGSSFQAIKKHVTVTYNVDVEKQATFIKKYLKAAVTSGVLIQTKGKGAAGSFKLSSTKSPSAKPKAKATAKAAVTKKTAVVKKPVAAKKPASAAVKKAPTKKAVTKAVTEKKKATKGPAAKPPKAKTTKAKPAAKSSTKNAKPAALKKAKPATAMPKEAAPKKAASKK